jgi:glycosyltransferase involved in cell wall biosynthesis
MKKKNCEGLVAAFARATSQGPKDIDLVILGDGSERAAIEGSIAATGMSSRIHLAGFKPYDVLPAYYGLAEAFAHVARIEQWGLVVNEAAAAGLPLVVSRQSGASAMVRNEVNGFIVDADDIGQISMGLQRIVSLSEDERRTMGEASRAIAEDWSPERYASGLEGACRAALSRPARGLNLADKVLFRLLGRMMIGAVR